MGRPDRPAGGRPCEPCGFELSPERRTRTADEATRLPAPTGEDPEQEPICASATTRAREARGRSSARLLRRAPFPAGSVPCIYNRLMPHCSIRIAAMQHHPFHPPERATIFRIVKKRDEGAGS